MGTIKIEDVFKISIIVPIHNLEMYLHNSISRILSLYIHDKIEVELICILDNCTDNSKKIVEDFANVSSANIKIFECNCGCAGLTRNIGLEEATGDWIWFIDGDDYLINPDSLIYFRQILTLYDNISVINFNFLFAEKICELHSNAGNMFCNVWSRIFNRKLIGDIRFGDKKIAEDLEFVNKVFAKLDDNNKLFHLNRLLYFYNYPRENSLTDLNSKKE